MKKWGWGAGLVVLCKQEFIFKHAKFDVPIRYPGGDDKKAVRHKSGNVGVEIQT